MNAEPTAPAAKPAPGRVYIIDALRGLSILLMVVYHLHFDFYEQGIIGRNVIFSPLVRFLQTFFASLFILMSGISCRFSRNNLKRGLLMFAAGMAVTAVTYLYDPDLIVRFGILHFLGAAAVLFALLQKPLDRLIPKAAAPFLCVLLAILTWDLPNHTYGVRWLWMFGFPPPNFISSDYFPILPNIFIYLFGTWLGTYIAAGRFPSWFYRFRCRPLEWIGKKTIWVYLVHQPVCVAIVWLIQKLR